jgi:RNA polymerase sigma-70 factor (ECF subfamily)
MTRPLNDLTAGGPERLTERMVGGEDEVQAVTRARGGDTEAFRFLVERHSRDVFRLAFRMTGNEHDAEDVVQETFLKAYRKLSGFEERAQFGSWVHRIAANCAYDLLRARVRHDDRVERAEGPAGDRTLTVPADDPSPERLVAGGEVARPWPA